MAQQFAQLQDDTEVERARLTIPAVACSGFSGEIYVCKDCAGAPKQ